MSLAIDISSPESLPEAAARLLEFAGHGRVFLFDAPMGAGKTTFIKQLCHVLGVSSPMSSPTYAVVNEYAASGGNRVYHFDLYRLRSLGELMDLGFEEYVDSGHYLMIEWPELAFPLIHSAVKVEIRVNGNNRYLCAEFIPG